MKITGCYDSNKDKVFPVESIEVIEVGKYLVHKKTKEIQAENIDGLWYSLEKIKLGYKPVYQLVVE